MDALVKPVSDDELAEAQRQSGWTDHRVGVLERLWLSGRSATQCACLLGGATRNAVIGVVHRKQFGAGGTPCYRQRSEHPRSSAPRKPRPPARARQVMAPLAPKVIKEPPPHVDDLAIPAEQRRTLLQLDGSCCHWPIGDPRDAGFFFCGAVAEGDGPYCASHAFRAASHDARRKPRAA